METAAVASSPPILKARVLAPAHRRARCSPEGTPAAARFSRKRTPAPTPCSAAGAPRRLATGATGAASQTGCGVVGTAGAGAKRDRRIRGGETLPRWQLCSRVRFRSLPCSQSAEEEAPPEHQSAPRTPHANGASDHPALPLAGPLMHHDETR